MCEKMKKGMKRRRRGVGEYHFCLKEETAVEN
jgi:hypothetical protein